MLHFTHSSRILTHVLPNVATLAVLAIALLCFTIDESLFKNVIVGNRGSDHQSVRHIEEEIPARDSAIQSRFHWGVEAVAADVHDEQSLLSVVHFIDAEIVYGNSTSPPWNFTTSSNWSELYPDCEGSLQSPIATDINWILPNRDGFLQILAPPARYVPLTPPVVRYDLIHKGNTENLHMLNVTDFNITLFSSVLSNYYKLSYVRVYGVMHRFHQNQSAARESVSPDSNGSKSSQNVEIMYEFIPTGYLSQFQNVTLLEDPLVATNRKVMMRVFVSFLIHDMYNSRSSVTSPNEDLELFLNGTDVIPFYKRPTFDKLFTDSFVMYPGSLPNPPCVERVVWIVSPIPIYATVKQIALLMASVKEGKPPTTTSIAEKIANTTTDVETLAALSQSGSYTRPDFPLNGRSIITRIFKSS